jgi:hypothetical protein
MKFHSKVDVFTFSSLGILSPSVSEDLQGFPNLVLGTPRGAADSNESTNHQVLISCVVLGKKNKTCTGFGKCWVLLRTAGSLVVRALRQ